MTDYVGIETLKGLTIASVIDSDDARIVFKTVCGRTFTMQHFQDCCEAVYVEDICGDWDDIIGSPIVVAEEVISTDAKPYGDPLIAAEHILRNGDNEPVDADDSHTWTFYKLDTVKGGVTIRWFGTSNGYYSESVSFYEGEDPW